MDKLEGLVTAASQLTKYDLNSIYNQAKNVVLIVSEMEAKVQKATNNDPWGVSSTLMQEIAQGTFNFQQFNKIMPCIYSQFIEREAKEWRQIYKALQLLEYIIRHGSERVVDDARSHLSTIKMFRNFHYIDEKGKDQGINVRNRSKELAELLQDLDRLRQERQKAKTNRNRSTGTGNDGASNAQAQPPTKTTATLTGSDEASGLQSAGRAAATRGTSNSALPNPSRRSPIGTPSSSQMAATATSNATFDPILGEIPQQPLALPSEKLSLTPASINMTESSQDVQIHNVGTVAHRGPEDNLIENSSEMKDIRWNTFLTQEVGRCGQYKLRGSDPVAHGGFSDILLGDVRLPTGIQPVAVKRLRFSGGPNGDNVLQKLEKRLTKELTIWMALQHPNIAPLLGHARTPAMCLISPWFRKGNLASFIKAGPSENRTNLVKGIAEGLAYLHCRTPAIVHGDIKPDNILIDESGDPVLIDFGLSKTLESDPDLASYSCTSLREAGNTRWIAPELLLQDGVSRSCSTDVYSFGCLAFFTFTGDVPFKGFDGPRLVAARCFKNVQPIPSGATYPVLDAMFGIMEMLSACWLEKPLERPTMLSITQQPPLSQL